MNNKDGASALPGTGLSPSVEPASGLAGFAASIPDAACPSCGGPSKFEGRCMACIAADYDDYEDDGCYECGGEGFVSDCVEEWACVDPEYGCDYCTRRCQLCNPAKRNAELDAVLSDAIAAQAIEARSGETGTGSIRQDESAVPAGDAPNTDSELARTKSEAGE